MATRRRIAIRPDAAQFRASQTQADRAAPARVGPTEQAIARRVAELVPDRATLQLVVVTKRGAGSVCPTALAMQSKIGEDRRCQDGLVTTRRFEQFGPQSPENATFLIRLSRAAAPSLEEVEG